MPLTDAKVLRALRLMAAAANASHAIRFRVFATARDRSCRAATTSGQQMSKSGLACCV
jgi:hypothetical protein